MFEANDNQKKLEELNIDDILLHAEDHVTQVEVGMGGEGGAEFLKQVRDFPLDAIYTMLTLYSLKLRTIKRIYHGRI